MTEQNVRHWTKSNLSIFIKNNPDHSDFNSKTRAAEVRKILETACEKWASVSHFNFSFCESESGSDITFEFGSTEQPNRLAITKLDIARRDSQASVIFSNTTHWTSINASGASPSINGAQVALVYGIFVAVKKSIESVFNTNVDLLTIAVHELGHALGLLEHAKDSQSIMRASISDMSNTFTYYMAGHSVPMVDAKTLWKLYAEPKIPPVNVTPRQGGYVIVGFQQEVTDKTSKAPARVLHTWGNTGPRTEKQLVASGHCWNRFMNCSGYGRIYFHLQEAEKVAPGTEVVLGGHIVHKNIDSTKHTHNADMWGFCVESGICEVITFGEMYSWNSKLNKDGYAYFSVMVGTVHGDASYSLSINGGVEKLGRSDSSGQYIHTTWGAPDSGTQHRFCHGRSYSSKYEGAYMQAFLAIEESSTSTSTGDANKEAALPV